MHELFLFLSSTNFSEDVELISGKIDSISLSDPPVSLSDCISLFLDMQQQQDLLGQVFVDNTLSRYCLCFQVEEKSASSKRGAKTAALESGSLVVPPVQVTNHQI